MVEGKIILLALFADCGCETRGTNGGSRVCDVVTGQCVCKPFVNSIRCNECADGTYNLQESNVFGCQGL